MAETYISRLSTDYFQILKLFMKSDICNYRYLLMKVHQLPISAFTVALKMMQVRRYQN